MSLEEDLFGDLVDVVAADHYVPPPGSPGDHIYVPGFGPCQVWSYGTVEKSRWVVPMSQQSSASAVLIHWDTAGRMVVDKVQSREGRVL